jgi:hypothetical protein
MPNYRILYVASNQNNNFADENPSIYSYIFPTELDKRDHMKLLSLETLHLVPNNISLKDSEDLGVLNYVLPNFFYIVYPSKNQYQI